MACILTYQISVYIELKSNVCRDARIVRDVAMFAGHAGNCLLCSERSRMETVTVFDVVNLADSVGQWLIFFWLFYRTYHDLQEAQRRHKDDLREVAGLKHPLQRQPTTEAQRELD